MTCMNLYNLGTGTAVQMADTNFSNTTEIQVTVVYHQ